METEKFLKQLLADQELLPEQEEALQDHKEEVTTFLRTEFGTEPSIKYAGSWAKGTMIRDNYDLDIVCYFPSSDDRSLKDIRADVSTHLAKKYILQPKASAERIVNMRDSTALNGYHVDVVPGRFIENTKDVFLNVAYGEKERIKTNLKTHIDHIKNSGCVPVIRLAKIWSHRNNIPIKTFILELFVVRSLSGSRTKDNLQSSFLRILELLKDEFKTLHLEDPANSGNVVSQLMSTAEKAAVAVAAESAYNKLRNAVDITVWEKVFCENSPPITFIPPVKQPSQSQPFSPRSPWAI